MVLTGGEHCSGEERRRRCLRGRSTWLLSGYTDTGGHTEHHHGLYPQMAQWLIHMLKVAYLILEKITILKMIQTISLEFLRFFVWTLVEKNKRIANVMNKSSNSFFFLFFILISFTWSVVILYFSRNPIGPDRAALHYELTLIQSLHGNLFSHSRLNYFLPNSLGLFIQL